MNDKIKEFAITSIKKDVARLPDSWQRTFKLMYGRNGGRRSVDEAVATDIDDVINEIPDDKIDWAMQQIENSLIKLGI